MIDVTFDFVLAPGGEPIVRHHMDVDPATCGTVLHPTLGATPVSVLAYLKALNTGVIPVAGSGWDAISNHPAYPGKTRLQVLLAEVVRQNLTLTRAQLGV